MQAQAFPARPITIISVPFAAGGPTDIVARVIAAQFSSLTLASRRWSRMWSASAGTIGMARAACAAPDGYTLRWAGMSTMSFSPTNLSVILQAHSINSFEPIGIVASAPIVLVVGKQVSATSVKEFAEEPVCLMVTKMANGHAGVGSSSHLGVAELTARRQAILSCPTRAAAPAINDMLGGQIHDICDQTTSVMTQVQAGAIRALAVLAQPALAGAAKRADRRGGGLSRRGNGALERAVCTQGHAARDRQAAQRRDRHGHRSSGGAQTILGAGCRSPGRRSAFT